MKDKIIFYKRVVTLANIFTGLAIILLLVHVSAPLFGGKMIVGAIPFYSVWIVLGLVLRVIAKRRISEASGT
jgi:hypothetical protein